MIGPGVDARVMVATKPVDFRKGADSLAALVKAEYGANPFSGVVHVFRAKRADRVKLVWWDGTGLWMMAKRLEQGPLPVARHPGRRDASDCGAGRRSSGGAGLAPGPFRASSGRPADRWLTANVRPDSLRSCWSRRTFPTIPRPSASCYLRPIYSSPNETAYRRSRMRRHRCQA